MSSPSAGAGVRLPPGVRLNRMGVARVRVPSPPGDRVPASEVRVSGDAVDLLLRGVRLPDRDEVVNVAIDGGAIVEVGPGARAAHESLDLGGRLLTPGLVEAHIHLDKALLSDRISTTAGTLVEALALSAKAKQAFTVDDIRA